MSLANVDVVYEPHGAISKMGDTTILEDGRSRVQRII